MYQTSSLTMNLAIYATLWNCTDEQSATPQLKTSRVVGGNNNCERIILITAFLLTREGKPYELKIFAA